MAEAAVPNPPPRREPVVEAPDWAVVEILRKKTGAERLEIAWGMWRFARDSLTAFLRDEHPEWSDEQVRAEVRRRMTRGAG